MTNSILKIVLSSGDLLDTSIEGIDQLRRMGYYIENNKLDMRTIRSMDINDIMMDDISLLIRRSGTSIKIIAHSHGKSNEKDKRENRYYFLYNSDSNTLSLLDILKDFTNKAIDESKKNNFEIIKNNKESIYLFDNLEKVIEKNALFLKDEDLLGAIRSCLNKGRQPQFETSNIEKAISFFISLDKELSINNIYYILYVPKRSKTLRDNNNIINIYVDQERHIPNIESIKEFKEYLQKYKKLKVEFDIKNKIKDTQKDIDAGILNSYSTWKDKRKDLKPEIRKGLAENLYSIVSKFTNDTIDEINLFSTSQSDRTKYNIGNVVEVNGWFMFLIQLSLVAILAFILGAYLSPYVPIVGHSDIGHNDDSITLIGNVAQTDNTQTGNAAETGNVIQTVNIIQTDNTQTDNVIPTST